ncbi:Propionate catabolism operon regulatory protein [Halobacillus karajensis]|uniref:Propionate catabolism operon regulatory protein n=1 Tax=Halobacillus karajensis TaxID=195088 RepID=A0A059NYZ6_9BACI|nr:Propionate catabolism operon regulatory protein [Halobacillus karajensis]
MIKALLIAPYQGLAEIAKNYKDTDNNFKVDVRLGNLEDGVGIAKQAEVDGYDIIISRGGTASLIQGKINIPVVDIKVSGYDILRILTLLKGTNGKAALVGFSNISRGASTICSILDMDLRTITITNSDEVTKKLEQLKTEGFSVVIGDVVTVHEAEKIGLQGILITSGKEAVLEAFDEAKRLYRLLQKMQSQAKIFSDALERFPRPLITVQEDGGLVFKNKKFREMLDHSFVEHVEVMALIEEVARGKEKVWKPIEYQTKRYFLVAYPLKSEKDYVNILIYNDFTQKEEGVKFYPNLSHKSIPGQSTTAVSLRNNIKRYASMNSPLWIEGEPGTGKMTYAGNLHFERFKHRAPLVSVNLMKVSMDQLQDLFFSNIERLPEEGTVVFHNIHKINEYEQERAEAFVQDVSERYQTILLSPDNVESLVKEGQLSHSLYYNVPGARIHLPPLRRYRCANQRKDSRCQSRKRCDSFNSQMGCRGCFRYACLRVRWGKWIMVRTCADCHYCSHDKQ